MSIDVLVTATPDGEGLAGDRVLNLDDDGLFWALWPALRSAPILDGRSISFDSTAVLDSAGVRSLLESLAALRAQVSHGQPTFSVHLGRPLLPGEATLTRVVSRESLLFAITELERLSQQALATSSFLAFIGEQDDD